MVDRQSILSVRQSACSDLESTERGFREIAARFILHSALATVGCVLMGCFLLTMVPLRPIGPHWRLIALLTDAPYSPAFWAPALLLGYLEGGRRPDRSACWVGPVGVVILAIVFFDSASPGRQPAYRLKQSQGPNMLTETAGSLFGLDPNSCGGDECLGRLPFTTPALTSVAYSIGAWAKLPSKRPVSGARL
jgi:hypothetical protein